MDRRNFLGTLVAGVSSVPAAGSSGRATQGRNAGTRMDEVGTDGEVRPRIRENFNSGWLFRRQRRGAGRLGSMDRENDDAGQIEPRFRDAYRPDYDDSWWKPVNLPHTWNAYDTMDVEPGYWRGIGWYRKHFALSKEYAGKRVFLEFEGANSVSEFWLNGQPIGEHKGGYTSFEFDVTDRIRFGEQENILTAKVDNLYRPSLPPTVKTDYSFYGGIYRDVWLRLNEPAYVSDVIWTTPSVSESTAKLKIEATVTNRAASPANFTLSHDIIDPDSRVVQTVSLPIRLSPGAAMSADQNLTLSKPRLWSPDDPNLYRIRTSLKGGQQLVDLLENPLGFRWYYFDPQRGFFLNGKRVQIQGTNWHQSYPGMGNALPNSRHVKDMEIIREMGVNFWRTSHYPHDPATIEASDHLGLMVWEELPINKEIGNADEYITNVLKMAEEMIRRDRNHPAVITWGIAGEINAPLSISKRVVGAVAKKYRQLDPTRPVAMHSPRGDEIEALVDVVGLDVGPETDAKHRKYPQRSYMTSEFSVSNMGRGIFGMGRESEDRACVNHENHWREMNKRPWMAGGAIWHQFDYDGETYDAVIPHVVTFGMADIWRIPKEVYYFYQSQWASKPMVHIMGHWTWPGEEGAIRPVKVYSNAGEVELWLNGKSLGVKSKRLISGDELLHPPLIWDVPYQPGTLKAVARASQGDIEDIRKTAGPPHAIHLESDKRQLKSGDPESLAYVTALVVDKHETVVPTFSLPITFTLYGPGELLKQTWLGHGPGLTWNAVAGMTRVAFRSTARAGHATISAYTPGLQMGRIRIMVAAEGQPDEMEFRERFKEDEP